MNSRKQVCVKRDVYLALRDLAQQQQIGTDDLAEQAIERGFDVIRQQMFFKDRMLKAQVRGKYLEDVFAVLARAGDEQPSSTDVISEK